MRENAKLFESAIGLLYDEKEAKVRLFGEEELDAVERLIERVLKS